MNYHEPVLLNESINYLDIQENGLYVDATFGGGGHAGKILEKIGGKGRLYGFDQDEDAARNAPEDDRFTFLPHNFRYMKRFLRIYQVEAADGVLADLGVSSHQLDDGARGFSYRFEAGLDMRMNRDSGKTAADIIGESDQDKLLDIFSRYGEVRNSRTLVQAILRQRSLKKIKTVGDFLQVLEPCIIGDRWRYLSQVFQALRIEVNDEIGALQDFLTGTLEVLKPGGRLVVISYHSLEDRAVKNFLKTGNVKGDFDTDFYGKITRPFEVLTKKPVEPSPEEIKRNPRARSARLRAGVRL